MDWENHSENPTQKFFKKQKKLQVKLLYVNKRQSARKRISVQTPFSLSTLELEQKISRRKTARRFGMTKITTPI